MQKEENKKSGEGYKDDSTKASAPEQAKKQMRIIDLKGEKQKS